MDWKSHIEELLKAGATVDRLAVGMGVTPNAVREILAGRTKSPRADSAFKLAAMKPEQFSAGEPSSRRQIGALVDSRMSKRALRGRLGLSNDAHLAKVLGLPPAEIETWPEEGTVPQLPEVLRLLGGQAGEDFSREPGDLDAGRVIAVEVA